MFPPAPVLWHNEGSAGVPGSRQAGLSEHRRSWAPEPHHPSWETGLTPPELSEHSCLAVLHTVIFFILKVYFKVRIRCYRVWLLVVGLTSSRFGSLQKQNSQQFPVQWIYSLVFQLEAGCAGTNSETRRQSIRLRDWWMGHQWHPSLDRRT